MNPQRTAKVKGVPSCFGNYRTKQRNCLQCHMQKKCSNHAWENDPLRKWFF